jgi:ubiquinone/menaquinone biosynthesis C-methylase UbiE
VTLVDIAASHLPGRDSAANPAGRHQGVVADALTLPFCDEAFDLVGCSLFAHHLDPLRLRQFVSEGLRVSRHALLINDLVRHRLHLALAFAGYPLMRNRVAWLDGLTSVRRAYVPEEIRSLLALDFSAAQSPRVEISQHYLFRMGVIVWKKPRGEETAA